MLLNTSFQWPFMSNLPMYIHHYCSLPVFLSIMRTKKLWLTSAEDMNDPDEVKYFLNSLMRTAEKNGDTKIKEILES